MQVNIRRALLSVSDKSRIVDLAQALHRAGVELVASGGTAKTLVEAGLPVTPVEKVSGSPESFQGRMKTLSFPICSGILYRRGDPSDEADLKKLAIPAIDCVVVNFYPFEQAALKPGVSRDDLVEEIDIGGPTMVRAAAKNAPDVLVLTDPAQYGRVIEELAHGGVTRETSQACASRAWSRVLEYDSAIAQRFGDTGGVLEGRRALRYGENPHQSGSLEFDPNGPIDWGTQLTPSELSYNNILDLSAAYALACDLRELAPDSTGVVIVKHNNPCGVALVPRSTPGAQKLALERAWAGDPVSAFGGVLVFTDALEDKVATWVSERFVELVAAPGLSKNSVTINILLTKRRNLKAVAIRRFGEVPGQTVVTVPGGRLIQSSDTGLSEKLTSVTKAKFSESRAQLGRFGIAVCRALKSNAIALVREMADVPGGFQLVGAGQGQPNRVEALKQLAIPRAKSVLAESGGSIGDCIMVSDAFFPFRDTVDESHAAGIRAIIQPGGSIKDAESVAACDEHGIAMALTGTRHFRH